MRLTAHHHYHTIRLGELKRLYWAHSIKESASSMTLAVPASYMIRLIR